MRRKKSIRKIDNLSSIKFKIMLNNILNEIREKQVREVAIPVDYLTPAQHYAMHKATEQFFKNGGGDECCDLCICLECCC